MRSRLVAALSLAAAALAGPLVAPAEAANAASDGIVAAGQIGSDVSFPQCADDGKSPQLKQALPVEPAFGIVGVNGGLGNTNNACFAAELQWALGSTAVTSQPRVGLYVNIQNPGHDASWWPTGDATQAGTGVDNPFGSCAVADDGPACSYVYGYSMAEADASPAIRHVALPAAYTWWLDIETSNDWSADRTANRAVLEGMVAAFRDVDAPVGLYSTHTQFDQIVGAVPPSSPLAALPSWLAGAVTEQGAAENCAHAPLAGGRVTLAQWWDRTRDLDFDLACGQLTVTRLPAVTGTARVGSRLTASPGSWAPGGVALAYRWLRNGQPIDGATGSTYLLSAADAGAGIAVRVHGTLPAYSSTNRTSAAVRVAPQVTGQQPAITGTDRAGGTLTADPGSWTPAPVNLSYQWRRAGAAIAGATGADHVVVREDLGRPLTVTVTGTKRGAATVRRTSAARLVPVAGAGARPEAAPPVPAPAPSAPVASPSAPAADPSPSGVALQPQAPPPSIAAAPAAPPSIAAAPAAPPSIAPPAAPPSGIASALVVLPRRAIIPFRVGTG